MTPMMPFHRWARTSLSSGVVPAISFACLRCTRLAGYYTSLLGVVGLPNVGKGGLIDTLKHEKVHSVASQVAGRTKEPRSVKLGNARKKWSNRKIPTTLPPTVRSVLFFPSRLRSNTLLPHVAEILAHLRSKEPMKIYPLPISNATPKFTKTLATHLSASLLPVLLFAPPWPFSPPRDIYLDHFQSSLVYTGVFVNLESRCPDTNEAASS
ncbi:hypothetical protein EDB83DRAFT_2520655 [Lactarius deliciosus]|nr:hypothetical protein EDB83DRAFT_2520655 [Lactarius deliciosus]